MTEQIERAEKIRDEILPGISTASQDEAEAWFVEMLKKHIDNETVYWDEENKVIKARAGVVDVFTITVGMDETQGVRGE